MKESRIVWLDLETSGLDPHDDEILEVGIIVTDAELNEQARFHTLVCPRRLPLTLLVNKAVFNMHRDSGLSEELAAMWESGRRVYVEDAESAIIAFLVMQGFEPQTVQLAGFGVHFDREMLLVHMPALREFCSHRIINVSTLRELWRRWVGEPETPRDEHRSIIDCERAIEQTRMYRRELFAQAGIGQYVDALKALLRHSWAPILFDYESLTAKEREIVTPEAYATFVQWVFELTRNTLAPADPTPGARVIAIRDVNDEASLLAAAGERGTITDVAQDAGLFNVRFDNGNLAICNGEDARLLGPGE